LHRHSHKRTDTDRERQCEREREREAHITSTVPTAVSLTAEASSTEVSRSCTDVSPFCKSLYASSVDMPAFLFAMEYHVFIYHNCMSCTSKEVMVSYIMDLCHVYMTGTLWRRLISCLILKCHFPQKSHKISCSFAENDLQTKGSYESSPPCTCMSCTSKGVVFSYITTFVMCICHVHVCHVHLRQRNMLYVFMIYMFVTHM